MQGSARISCVTLACFRESLGVSAVRECTSSLSVACEHDNMGNEPMIMIDVEEHRQGEAMAQQVVRRTTQDELLGGAPACCGDL